MALEQVNLENISGLWSGNKKLLAFTLIIACLALFISFKYSPKDSILGLAFLFFIVGFFLLFIPFYWGVIIYERGFYPAKNHKNKLQYLTDNGFSVDYSALGIAIDESQRKVAFTLYHSTQIYICDFYDIRSWSPISETTTTITSNGNIYQKDANAVLVNIANPKHPQFIFSAKSHRHANEWIARLSALINK